MAISLKELKTTRGPALPPRLLIYGPPGKGKTSLASQFPDPIFIDVEQGIPTGIAAPSFGEIAGYDAVMDNLGRLASEDHDFRTVIIDTLDRLEPMVWAKVCADNQFKSIEDPGYGKGYVLADRYWSDLQAALNYLRRERGMTIILIAHSTVERFDSPTTAPYSRYDIRLHKRALALFQDEVDGIFFVNEDPTLKTDDVGFNKKVTHAEGGGVRWIYTDGRPAFTAKNRFGTPDRIMFTKGEGYRQLAPYLPTHNNQTTAEAA
ncbi:ATP-binding protein [Brevundimonas olei]|uniref:ATP-binding protein n=1 Tax=Brevundimonas olei TaxID=657642 RepID=UPI0031DED926